MLKIYASDAAGQLQLQPEITHNNLIYMVAPSLEEIHMLSQRLAIPEAYLSDALDHNPRPHMEKSPHAQLMVLNAPQLINEHAILNQAMYQICAVGIIHTENHLVIVSSQALAVMDDVIEAKYGHFHSHMKTRMSLLIFKAIADSYNQHLTQMNKKIADYQQRLKKSYRNQELFGLMGINKSLVNFSTSLAAMNIVYQRLMQGVDVKIHPLEQKLLKDIWEEMRQAAEITEMRRESLSNLMDAYAAIVHNNLNAVLKMLTTLAIVMVIPTMIGSIFSMNVALPYEDSGITTIVVSACMLITIVVLLYVFYKKNYLRV